MVSDYVIVSTVNMKRSVRIFYTYKSGKKVYAYLKQFLYCHICIFNLRCEILFSHGGVDKDSILLGGVALSLVLFRGILVPPWLGAGMII